MKPLDPRLIRYASGARVTLAVGGLIALLRTGAVIAFSWLVTHVIVEAIAGQTLPALVAPLGFLALVIVVRGVLVWWGDATAARGGATVICQLRSAMMTNIASAGPQWLTHRRSSEIALIAGRGMDALDGYFSRYIPQLILTAVATPLLVIVIGWSDLTSGIIVVCTLPLIPVFMVLVGIATQNAQKRQWSALSRLSVGFLDVVEGLATLKLFGRQHRQAPRIQAISEEYRVRTMRVLRMSFVSGFVLELAATLSVALVAVAIGLRLMGGSLDLSTGLFVLLLAPEVFLPLRNVGASYHAAAEGIEAASRCFEILDSTEDDVSSRANRENHANDVEDGADLALPGLVWDKVTVRYDEHTLVGPFSAYVAPGTFVVLAAPSGSGKTTLIECVLGFREYEGAIAINGYRDTHAHHRAVSWSGQHPSLRAGTVASNVALGDVTPDRDAIIQALHDAVFDECDPDQLLGEDGGGLSGGQAQRIALARAFYRLRRHHCSVLLVDEPTSALDHATETRIVATLQSVARSGVAVVVASHRAAVIESADTVVSLQAGERVAH